MLVSMKQSNKACSICTHITHFHIPMHKDSIQLWKNWLSSKAEVSDKPCALLIWPDRREVSWFENKNCYNSRDNRSGRELEHAIHQHLFTWLLYFKRPAVEESQLDFLCHVAGRVLNLPLILMQLLHSRKSVVNSRSCSAHKWNELVAISCSNWLCPPQIDALVLWDFHLLRVSGAHEADNDIALSTYHSEISYCKEMVSSHHAQINNRMWVT